MTRRGDDRIVGRGRVECWEEQHGGSVFFTDYNNYLYGMVFVDIVANK